MASKQNNSGIRPIGGYCVIKPVEVEEKTAGGIILTADTRDKEKFGTQAGDIVAAAEDVRFGLQSGQRVAFARYAGTMIKGADGEDYRLIEDEHIKGVFAA